MATIRGKGRAIRTLVSVLLLLSIMVSAMPAAYAASLTSLSLTMSSTVPGDTSVGYTFGWTASGSTVKGVKLEFCQEASGSCTPLAVDFSSTSGSLGAGPFSGFTPDFTSNSTVTATDAVGDTTSSVTQVISGITNTGQSGDGTPTVFYVWITTYSDTGLSSVVDGPSVVAAAVIPAISVSGTQDAILQLTVSAVSSGATIGDASDAKTTSALSTATTLPFGNFIPIGVGGAASKAVAHSINVVTNGPSGYTASVQGGSSAMTRDGGSETISYVGADTNWAEASELGFGVNAQDEAGAGNEANEGLFGTVSGDSLLYEPISSAVTLASGSVPTAGVDTMVVYRVQVNATTAAGTYSGTINYTVLPNF